MIIDFINLIFPNRCRACERSLVQHESVLCTFCRFHLPKTNFHRQPENPVMKQFWGKANIHHATAYFFFHRSEKVKQLIHLLKYKGDTEVGYKLGNMFGSDLRESEIYRNINFLVPVPLHASRKHSRGYNQSEIIAQGLKETLDIPIATDLLVRKLATVTQTKKKRYNRYENMKEVFAIKNMLNFSGKHFLLIDDVITTGSTLAACAEKLLQIPGSKVSVAALAFAHH